MPKQLERKVEPARKVTDDEESMSLFETSLRQTTNNKVAKDDRRRQREHATAQQRSKFPSLTDAIKPGLHTLDELRNIQRAGPTLPPKDSRAYQSISGLYQKQADEPRYTPFSSDLPSLEWIEAHYNRLEQDAEHARMPLKKIAAQSMFKSLYNLKACINAARAKEAGASSFFRANDTANKTDEVARPTNSMQGQADAGFKPKSHFQSRDEHVVKRDDSSRSHDPSGQAHRTGHKNSESRTANSASRTAGPPVDDLNKLSSQLLRAEMMNDAARIQELKTRIAALAFKPSTKSNHETPFESERADDQKELSRGADSGASNAQMLMRTTHRGQLRPVTSTSSLRSNASVRDMVRYEKEHTVSDAVADYITTKRPRPAESTKTDGEYDDVADDARGGTTSTDLAASSSKRSKKLDSATLDKMDRRERERAILDHKQREQAFDKCKLCLDNNLAPKYLIIAIGEFCYLHLPQGQNLVEHQCEISPVAHVPNSLLLDENVFEEMQKFKHALTRMYKDELRCDVVFVETHKHRKQYKHCVVECFPVDAEQFGEGIPFAFHNALMSSEEEWAQNVKLVDIKKRGGLQRAVPKELPFFAVEFNDDGSGYAHVIENEANFPDYFGKEVIAGVLDIEPYLYRKVHTEPFEKQCAKVAAFEKMWAKHKFTG